jgi:hypothetical protein
MLKCNQNFVGDRTRWFTVPGMGYLATKDAAPNRSAQAAFDPRAWSDSKVRCTSTTSNGGRTSALGVAATDSITTAWWLFIDNNAALGLGSICSCSLLGGGQALLTAAHCVTNNAGVKNVIDGVDGNTVTFNLAGGPQTFNFNSAGVMIAPGYNGDTAEGNDIAVITLANPVPAAIPRYALWSGAPGSEIGLQGTKVGYGKSGHGNIGHDNNTPGIPGDDPFGAGTKRAGFNEYDADARNILSPLGGGVSPFDGGPQYTPCPVGLQHFCFGKRMDVFGAAPAAGGRQRERKPTAAGSKSPTPGDRNPHWPA